MLEALNYQNVWIKEKHGKQWFISELLRSTITNEMFIKLYNVMTCITTSHKTHFTTLGAMTLIFHHILIYLTGLFRPTQHGTWLRWKWQQVKLDTNGYCNQHAIAAINNTSYTDWLIWSILSKQCHLIQERMIYTIFFFKKSSTAVIILHVEPYYLDWGNVEQSYHITCGLLSFIAV